MKVEVLKAGLFSNLQDRGRLGYQHLGVPIGGSLDTTAAQMALHIAGATIDQPLIECTLIGPTLKFDDDCTIAITGANMNPMVNGHPINSYQSIQIHSDDTLSLGNASNGARAYIAINGQWKTKSWLGSVSPVYGAYQMLTPDSILRKGQFLDIFPNVINENLAFDPPSFNNRIHVMAGPESNVIDASLVFNRCYTMSHQSNRMAIILNEKIDVPYKITPMISSGVIPGTIQLTPSGQLMILMADAQTTGGYHRIGQVKAADIDKLAQIRIGGEIEIEFLQ
jgi:biotin-dependent carboxylase-like uncharacterized protein